MSQFRRRHHVVAGFILGLVPAATASAQGPPPVFPPSGDPANPPVAVNAVGDLIVRPVPPPMLVPPQGVGPIWSQPPIDPVALEKLDKPGFIQKKLQSWHWRRLQGKFYGYPEEFQPRPLGAASYENGKIMVANGAAARLVLYRYDFIEGTAELSPRGFDQLVKFTAQLSVSPYPLIIERTLGDPALAESRRFAVLARLAQSPCPLTSDRVLVGIPTPNGLSGTDAQIIAGNGISRTQGYGPPIPLLSNGVNSPGGVTSGGSGIVP